MKMTKQQPTCFFTTTVVAVVIVVDVVVDVVIVVVAIVVAAAEEAPLSVSVHSSLFVLQRDERWMDLFIFVSFESMPRNINVPKSISPFSFFS